ncbi:MAG: hypothetical protein DRG30_07075 [Epsilonproteobacteria bacterium]|nr:MAG: hypothetical protein DRG30_07075 [Campylobacterota bacterium]
MQDKLRYKEDYLIKRSPYDILRLEGDFNFKDIKKAYREAIREYPPEQNPDRFVMISDAYDRLTNEKYFVQDIESMYFALDVSSLPEGREVVDNSKHLKEIFEVPFII